jgi:CDP-diacylglycerol---serine O-phosphatidyltransferase
VRCGILAHHEFVFSDDCSGYRFPRPFDMNDLSPLPDEDDGDDVHAAPRRRRKGVYILPNLFTLAALFGGFYAIVMAMNGRYEQSCYGVFCAMVLDSLDGRVARMTNTQSAFGAEMDSLSDMVSFGAAPALIVYEWALKGLGKAGWGIAFFYCACAALRLARFNTNLAVVDKRYFQGLPSPAAAALVVSFIWVVVDTQGYTDVNGDGVLAWAAAAATFYAGVTMVVNVPFYSFKDLSFKRSVPFIVIVLIALAIGIINLYPARIFFAIFCIYALSGYLVYAYKRAKGRPVSAIALSTDEPDEVGLHR